MAELPNLPDGFVECWRHQCPKNEFAPHASEKWCFSAREIGSQAKMFRGRKEYYDTLELAVLGCIEEINRRLEQRKKLKRNRKND